MRKDTIKIQKINEPRDPEIVLFGLIFESFGPLNNFPKRTLLCQMLYNLVGLK